MRTFIFSLILAGILVLISAPTPAHNELPSHNWCVNGEVVAVANFEFFPRLLMQQRDELRYALAAEISRDPSLRDCGAFDDDYDVGRSSAVAHCSQFATSDGSQGDIGTVLPLVSSPQTYLHKDHHDIYSLTQGLSGTCVRCEPRSVR
jgi:hypothetical protein